VAVKVQGWLREDSPQKLKVGSSHALQNLGERELGCEGTRETTVA
jgi:hypothetical protein